ncbi:MAG: 2-oxo acid dehydrogenase subunit E2 [Caldilineaceae bacterium]
MDLTAVMELRKRRNPSFEKRHGLKVGFMSFFTKAVISALKAFPALNAEIRGDEIVLKQYYDIGIAVGAEEGLVVPVVRNADRMSFAEIEAKIKELASKVRMAPSPSMTCAAAPSRSPTAASLAPCSAHRSSTRPSRHPGHAQDPGAPRRHRRRRRSAPHDVPGPQLRSPHCRWP